MATMNGSGRSLVGQANVDLGLTASGGYGGNDLKTQLADELKKRKKKSYEVQDPVKMQTGMGVVSAANSLGVGGNG
jgi:hypothetical protein